jgi:hypothetical protein
VSGHKEPLADACQVRSNESELGADDSESGQRRLVTRSRSLPSRSRRRTTHARRLTTWSKTFADPRPTTGESGALTADLHEMAADFVETIHHSLANARPVEAVYDRPSPFVACQIGRIFLDLAPRPTRFTAALGHLRRLCRRSFLSTCLATVTSGEWYQRNGNGWSYASRRIPASLVQFRAMAVVWRGETFSLHRIRFGRRKAFTTSSSLHFVRARRLAPLGVGCSMFDVQPAAPSIH